MTAIGEYDALWQRYWKDFVANRFHLNAGEDKLTFELIHITLARPLSEKDVKKKMVALHCTAHTNQINLAKLVSSLRPLQYLQKVDQIPDHVQNPGVLYEFIVDTLFGALAEECLKCGREEMSYCEPEKLEVWRECYRDVVCMYYAIVKC